MGWRAKRRGREIDSGAASGFLKEGIGTADMAVVVRCWVCRIGGKDAIRKWVAGSRSILEIAIRGHRGM